MLIMQIIMVATHVVIAGKHGFRTFVFLMLVRNKDIPHASDNTKKVFWEKMDAFKIHCSTKNKHKYLGNSHEDL